MLPGTILPKIYKFPIIVVFCAIFLGASVVDAVCRPKGIQCRVPNQCCSYECVDGEIFYLNKNTHICIANRSIKSVLFKTF